MKNADEYRARADECRQMAKRSRTSPERDMLLNMASTWDALAVNRAAEIDRQRRIQALESPGTQLSLNHAPRGAFLYVC
jgi:hypothetical protein